MNSPESSVKGWVGCSNCLVLGKIRINVILLGFLEGRSVPSGKRSLLGSDRTRSIAQGRCPHCGSCQTRLLLLRRRRRSRGCADAQAQRGDKMVGGREAGKPAGRPACRSVTLIGQLILIRKYNRMVLRIDKRRKVVVRPGGNNFVQRFRPIPSNRSTLILPICYSSFARVKYSLKKRGP